MIQQHMAVMAGDRQGRVFVLIAGDCGSAGSIPRACLQGLDGFVKVSG